MRNSIVKSKVDEIQEFNCQFVISTLFQHRQQRIGGGGGGESIIYYCTDKIILNNEGLTVVIFA